MKKRSLAGDLGVIVFLIALVCIVLGFLTSSWLVSDRRITSSKFEQMGLWKHCFRSLPDPSEADAARRYFVGCRWIFDPYTAGYDKLKPFFFPSNYDQFLFNLYFIFNSLKLVYFYFQN